MSAAAGTGPAPLVAAVAGATGLVGRYLLERLLVAPGIDAVVAYGRRAPSRAHPRLVARVVDFARLAEGAPPSAPPGGALVGLCALGTTIRAAGSEAAFRAVDLDAALAFARRLRDAGAARFVLVSSVGADPRARSFYLRVKGELEEAVAALGFPSFVALRPSLLLGPRAEARPGEAIAQRALPFLAPLLAGGLRRYRAIGADVVAGAMVAAAREAPPGRVVWHPDELVAAAARA